MVFCPLDPIQVCLALVWALPKSSVFRWDRRGSAGSVLMEGAKGPWKHRALPLRLTEKSEITVAS